MEHLWTPWRSTYVTGKTLSSECIFCAALESTDDKQHFVLYRGLYNFVLLNRFPYTSGHLMIAPNQHASRLSQLEESAAGEMWKLARLTEVIFADIYHPDGVNLGMNLGVAAGAGIAAHLHLHMLPRWNGDANFMSVVGDTRVMPELLEDTFAKLQPAFAKL
jgi:ATP adenylyltransferase